MASKTITWNTRGLCNVAAQGSIKLILRLYMPDVLWVQETKIEDKILVEKAEMWDDDWGWIFMPSMGASGGMLAIWRKSNGELGGQPPPFSCLPGDFADLWQSFTGHMNRFGQLLNRGSVKEVLLNWVEINNRGLAAMVWNLLPYAIRWNVWGIRNEIIFNGGTLNTRKMVLQVKGLLWDWLEMSNTGQDAKKDHNFTDLVVGWESLVVDNW
ncbi:hypothetical protein FRX31_015527 [Thalictrum thalictroides]|uniref:Uncharacterized protein n=1 Tax=Thalictrum thalictroides TaxID=46969 RepID=A0A7J6WDE1_THATH|nr:hypothetical protein FRX31_015527 [Thalictrum thalictroides]